MYSKRAGQDIRVLAHILKEKAVKLAESNGDNLHTLNELDSMAESVTLLNQAVQEWKSEIQYTLIIW